MKSDLGRPLGRRFRTVREQAAEAILADILKGTLKSGERLPTIREFSVRFGVSFRTIQQALFELQSKGYVVMRQGAGTFVAATRPAMTWGDAVALCMDTRGHVFGELAGILTRRLQSQGRIPSLVDVHGAGWQEVLAHAARSDVRDFVVHGGPHFAYDVLRQPVFARKRLIGVLDWLDDGLADRMSLAVVDHRLGGAMVARWLAAEGHTRVVLVGTDNTLAMADRQSAGFRETWQGSMATILIRYDSEDNPALDVRSAAALFRGRAVPTAVFGMRDYDVVCLQRALAGEGVDLAALCARVGYGNTPWSRTEGTVFSSVDWNLDDIAAEVCRLVSDAAGPGSPIRHVAVAPRLVRCGTAMQSQ